jgi:hypothetical protein
MRIWFNRTFSSVHTALQLIRNADEAHDYHLIYSASTAVPGGVNAAHQFELEPSGRSGEAYLDWCLDFCRRHEVGIFVPGKEASLISGARAQFAACGTRVLSVAAPAVLDLLHDKGRFYAEVDSPMAMPAEFRAVTNIAQFDAAYDTLRARHPVLCIKPAVSVYGLGFSRIDEVRSSAQILLEGSQYQIGLDDLRRGFAAMGEFRTMLLMEYLDGHEYSVDCLGNNGKLLCAIPRKKPLRVGQGQEISLQQDILDATGKLAADYGLNGLFNVQFRESAGSLRLLEINPRMSGGIGMACLAGPNLPYLAIRGFDLGFEQLIIPQIQAGMRVGERSCPIEYR